jgi:hypothetical protein
MLRPAIRRSRNPARVELVDRAETSHSNNRELTTGLTQISYLQQ